ncbi:MAG: methyltransferase domain-containing protein [Armatimonadetes bacterium]|nr:MAG: methyltransferase domain-containing protein [Armatimonadota bacterium]
MGEGPLAGRVESFLNSEAKSGTHVERFGVKYLDLTEGETPYWGEIPQEALQEVLQAEDVEKAFDETVRKLGKPRLSDYALNVGRRAAWRSVLPIDSGELAWDVGAGFGANTIALAQRFEHVVATDIVPERLAFIGKRCERRGIENVTLIRAPFEKVPLSADVADLIVCNGVLEWVGAWGAEQDPEEIQRSVLRRLCLALKESGHLYIGIENRFGLAAWRGVPDHSGLRFTSLMPRAVASLVMRAAASVKARKAEVGDYTVQRDYRTYTHSPSHWRRMLSDCGFAQVRIWGANDYNYTEYAFPTDEPEAAEILSIWKSAANRPHLLNRAIAAATFRLPHCLLVQASPRSAAQLDEKLREALQQLGEERSAFRVLAVDTRSHDQWIRRYVLRMGDEIRLLTLMPEEIAAQRSRQRVRLTPTGASTEEPKTVSHNGEAILLEPFRKNPSLLHTPIGGPEIARKLEQWSHDRFSHYLTLQCGADPRVAERRFSQIDADRLIEAAPEPFSEAQALKDRARRLIGSSLRFGVAHGDLAPENLFLDGEDLVIEDWNDTVPDAPVAMDLLFLAFTWAYGKGLRHREIHSCLSALHRTLTPDEFAKRHALLCLSLLHWRALRETTFLEEAQRRIRVALALDL